MRMHPYFTTPVDVQADWLLAPIYENAELSNAVKELDAALHGAISRLIQNGDAAGKTNELTSLLDVNGIAARRVLLVGLGKREQVNRSTLIDAAATAARQITGKQLDRVAFIVPADISDLSLTDATQAVGIGLMQGSYGPGLRKSKIERFAPHEFRLIVPAPQSVDIEKAAERAAVIGQSVALAQELVNTPPCELFPQSFADRARQVAEATGLECVVMDERQIEAERMGSLLGVARGSEQPPRFVVLRHKGGGNQTLGLVGKGVTFDSGGLSLKTTEQMIDMKCDMAGAAAVLAAMQAIALLKIPVNVSGYMPLVENMPSGKALKLGDVVTARNGKTIEIHNTDAEGRLILADALAYAVDDQVDHLVDLATLTGACIVALGTEIAGVMSNDEQWSRRVLDAANRAGEKAWPLPMYPLFNEMIKSNVADMKNTGGSRWGGAITAAKLLEEFVGEKPWVHLDIAGPAWKEHETCTRDAGGTGCFVRTLVELAEQYGHGAALHG